MLEYGRRGLIGVLTPQSNTTVEAEFWIMAPPGVNLINARLVSQAPALNDRLTHYFNLLETTLDHFETAPLTAAAFACTGSSYLIGADDEAAMVTALEEKRGLPIVTAAQAVVQALRTLDARRIALLSPYPALLTEASARYWRSNGFEITEIVPVSASGAGAFHPIYAVTAQDAGRAMTTVTKDADAVLMLGTGVPTLRTILERSGHGVPVISSMLCLGWLSIARATGRQISRQSLLAWIGGSDWSDRFWARHDAADTV